jgi:hypothetical protein
MIFPFYFFCLTNPQRLSAAWPRRLYFAGSASRFAGMTAAGLPILYLDPVIFKEKSNLLPQRQSASQVSKKVLGVRSDLVRV